MQTRLCDGAAACIGLAQFLGGLIVSTQGTSSLSFYGAAPMATTIVASLYAASLANR